MIPRDFFIWHKFKIEGIKTQVNFEKQLSGLICATIANFAPYKKNKKYKIEDFVGRERRQQPVNEMFNEVKKLNAKFGGEVKNNGNS